MLTRTEFLYEFYQDFINSYEMTLFNCLINASMHPTVLSDIATVSKKTQGIMADGQGDDDDDEGVPEEKRLADDVRADNKVEEKRYRRSA